MGKKIEGSCSTGQSPQWAVVPVEEEEEYISLLCTGTRYVPLLLGTASYNTMSILVLLSPNTYGKSY
jgi:hypothetical protein